MDNRIIEIVLIIVYNLALLAGASYLIVAHDFSPWMYLLALIFAAGWDAKPKVSIETGK